MNRKITMYLLLLFVVVIIVSLFTGCNKKQACDYTDFKGKDIAVITGVLTYNTTEKIGANPVNYNNSSSAVEDVRNGRVAGYMHALTLVQVIAAQSEGFEVIAVPKDIFSALIGGISHDKDIIDRFNAFLASISDDGTLDEMKSRWFSNGVNYESPIPEIQNSGGNGALTVVTTSDAAPFAYKMQNGNFNGFSVEMALRFGAYEGKTVEFIDVEFGELIPYIADKKADISLANMAITEDRAKDVLFSNPFFEEQHGILSLK